MLKKFYDFLARRYLNELEFIVYEKLDDIENWSRDSYYLSYKVVKVSEYRYEDISDIELWIGNGDYCLSIGSYNCSKIGKYLLWKKVEIILDFLKHSENSYIYKSLLEQVKGLDKNDV